MATHKLHAPSIGASNTKPTFAGRILAAIDRQQPNAVAWWLGSLLLHGCILIPLTFLLVYSLGGPVLPFLFISMSCFFVNVIANMGGAPFRISFGTLLFSLFAHLVIVIATLVL